MTGATKPWEFYNPVQVVFGPGTLGRLADHVPKGRVLLVTSKGATERGLTDRLLKLLSESNVDVLDSVEPNPGLRWLETEVNRLKHSSYDSLVAAGGGSAIDSAKAVGAALVLRENGSSLREHLEASRPLPDQALAPVVAVPTTAGSGSEVTPFATVWDLEKRHKHSLHSRRVFPLAAVIDPELTLELPVPTTIAAGLDALCQALESIWNRHANPITLELARRAASLALSALPEAVREPRSLIHRTRMMEASLLAGLAISHTRTALAHSISYPITARWGVPHGLACGFTLPSLLNYNAKSDDGRLIETARLLGFPDLAGLEAGLRQLLDDLNVPAYLRNYLPNPLADLFALVPLMHTPDRAGNNLRTARYEDIAEIIQRSVSHWP